MRQAAPIRDASKVAPWLYRLAITQCLLYRRQRAYRLSPAGQAETLLAELRANPGEALCILHDLAREDPDQLELLPGIGTKTAQAISEYRKQQGLFKTVSDLTKVRGIGEKTLEVLRKHILV